MKDFSKLRMWVEVIGEHGLRQALYGVSLSYNLSTSWLDFKTKFSSDEEFSYRMMRVADNLANRDTGENKFLESISVWLDVDAPREWWAQFDTYRVGMSKNSESTMHSILRNPLTQQSFVRDVYPSTIELLNKDIEAKNFYVVKDNLPEGFLQRREICTNYKTLRHIVRQRKLHRLPEWRLFVSSVYNQLTYPEWLGIEYNADKQVFEFTKPVGDKNEEETSA